MMTRFLVLSAVLASPVLAQINIQVQLPSISFSAPPTMVVAEPGVQVVADNDEEVFLVDNWFWTRRGPHWFRTRTHTGGWMAIERRFVPPSLARLQVGRYRRWRGAHAAVPIANPAPPPVAAQPPPPAAYQPPPPSQGVIQVKEIHAERVYARVIYCKEIHARDGRIARQGGKPKGKEDWGGKELRVREVRADTIYAKEIHADWVEAEETWCKEVKLGR